ncbi:MAG: rRNA maturation RNase YbeY [Candidatus Neomarinimicrobiota bacterium]
MINITSDCDPSLISPDIKYIQLLVKNIFAEKKIKDAELSYIFCNDNFLSKLKKKFFKKNHFTDVIAFRLNSYEEKRVEGEIYISLPRAKENAKIYEEPYEKEVARLIIHGCLHLLGYSDETKNQKQIMTNLENVFLQKMIWGKLF